LWDKRDSYIIPLQTAWPWEGRYTKLQREAGTKRATRPKPNNLKDMMYVILELSLCRNKCQSADTVMKRMGLHLGTSKDHPKMLTDMCEVHLHMLISSQRSNEYAK